MVHLLPYVSQQSVQPHNMKIEVKFEKLATIQQFRRPFLLQRLMISDLQCIVRQLYQTCPNVIEIPISKGQLLAIRNVIFS